MLYDLVKEIREDQKKHGEELAKQSVSLNSLGAEQTEIKKDLKYHIKRTDEVQESNKMLTELHQDNQKKIQQNETRIKLLEEPIEEKKAVDKYKERLRKHWKYWLGIGGIIAGIVSKLAGLW